MKCPKSGNSPLTYMSCLLPRVSCLLLLAPCYLLTLPATLSWSHHGADGGDLATAVALGRLPHPPGFPTYLLLGRLFLHLPWGDPAWSLNLLSALSAATAAVLVAVAGNPESAICNLQSAICLALSPLLWSQALITEVYAPAALFSAAVLFLALRRRPAWLLGVIWGLGLGVHPTLLFLAPLVLWGAASGLNHGERTKVSSAVKNCAVAILTAIPVAAILYGPLLLAFRAAPSPWVRLDSPADWWAYVSGRMYHRYLFALPAVFWPRRLLACLGLLARQFTPVGALLALWGGSLLWLERRSLALVTALSFGLFSLYAIGYNTADSLVYLVPAMPLAALWLGRGMAEAARWLEERRRWASLLLLLLPLALAIWGWREVDLHGDDSAVRWARQTLRAAPPRALLVTSQDAATFTLWYVQDVLGERPDVLVLDRDLWAHEPYRKMIAREAEMPLSEQPIWPADRPVLEVRAPLDGGHQERSQ